MCEAQDFLRLTHKEVEEQCEGYTFTEEEFIELVMEHPKRWNEIYKENKHLLYSDKKATKKRLRKEVKQEQNISKLLKELKHQDTNEYPHNFVINRWLKKDLNIEWKEIPLKYQTKDSMKPELVSFIEKTKGIKIRNSAQMDVIDRILTIFQVKCTEMAKKEADIQEKTKERLMITKIKTEARNRLLASIKITSLQLKGIQEDRKKLVEQVYPTYSK